MKNFIEVTWDGQKILINTNHIVSVVNYDSECGINVLLLDTDLEKNKLENIVYYVTESYEQIKKLIESAH